MQYISRIVLIAILMCFLNGCQTVKGPQQYPVYPPEPSAPNVENTDLKDSAPLGPIPTFFKAIIPQDEPLSRYGNPSSYRVAGRTYRVMRSSAGYHEKGIASWYASKFHQGRTSSGERYDMYALTAAHKTLPLPTYLKVKNLDNGRQIIVKVNDRGPFHRNRIIDLSYGSAVKLGIFPRGTAHVELTAINVSEKTSVKAHKSHYYIQAGAFKQRASANAMQSKLRRITHQSVQVNRIRGQFIVRVGPLNSSKKTEQIKKTLSRQGIRGAFSVLL
ncbi:MAG: septal ring lytic transglycosylase RlpA family protein [Gammaproteobacteria bacterium]|nr:septal ring lytic transglycosylase RlpA family protein [Gammaproteobacteria bacterium]